MTTTERREKIIEVLRDSLPLSEETKADSVWYGTDLYEEAADRLLALTEQKKMEKLQAFKKYVHDRLDALGIDKHEEQNAINGCRIGSRIDDIVTLISRDRLQPPSSPVDET